MDSIKSTGVVAALAMAAAGGYGLAEYTEPQAVSLSVTTETSTQLSEPSVCAAVATVQGRHWSARRSAGDPAWCWQVLHGPVEGGGVEIQVNAPTLCAALDSIAAAVESGGRAVSLDSVAAPASEPWCAQVTARIRRQGAWTPE